MENLQVTSQGLDAALSAGEMGLKLKLTRFRLGAGTGYTPASDGSDTDLQGPVVHTDAISGYVLEANGQLKLVLRLSAAAGTFTFGELAIDAEVTPGVFLMFASAVLPAPLTKESSLSSSAPSTFTFNCYIKLEQGNSIIQVVPGDVNAGGADYSAQIYNLQQQINNIGTPSNFQPQIDALNLQVSDLTINLANKPDLATYAELSSASPPVDKAVAANHLRNKAADNLIQLTPGGLYLPQASIIGLSGGLPTCTGPTVFSNADNSVVCSGLVSALDLEVGDVVKVEQSSLGNNKLFTVTSITDNNNLKFNETHSFQKVGIKSLKTETATIKFTRVCKWYNAHPGLGQGWNFISSSLKGLGGQSDCIYPQAANTAVYGMNPTFGLIGPDPWTGWSNYNTSHRTINARVSYSGSNKTGSTVVFAFSVRVDDVLVSSSSNTGSQNSLNGVEFVVVPNDSVLNVRTSGNYNDRFTYMELS